MLSFRLSRPASRCLTAIARFKSTSSIQNQDSKDADMLEALEELVGSKPRIRTPPTKVDHAFHSLAETESEISGKVPTQPIDVTWDPKDLPFRQTLDDSTREYTEREWAATLIHGRGVHNPYYHPQTYGIPVASVHFRSHHIRLLEFFTHFASHAASSLGIPISRVARLPTQRTLWTVPRSPFAHKKAQENFDRRVHKRAIKAWDADPEVVDRWLMYLRKHALGGVGMRVTRWERLPVGYGATRLAHIKQQMAGPAPQTVEEAVKALGDEIIVKELAALESGSRICN